jgi:hypothetical protein
MRGRWTRATSYAPRPMNENQPSNRNPEGEAVAIENREYPDPYEQHLDPGR